MRPREGPQNSGTFGRRMGLREGRTEAKFKREHTNLEKIQLLKRPQTDSG